MDAVCYSKTTSRILNITVLLYSMLKVAQVVDVDVSWLALRLF